MTTSPAIGVILEAAWLALTPFERFSAARRFTKNLTGQSWMVLIGIAAMLLMAVLFTWVSISRARQERKQGGQSFIDHARRTGLSNRECQLLTLVANKAGLKRLESIFTMGAAFGLGAVKVIEEGLGPEQTAEEGEQLKVEIAFLREKLGFARKRSYLGGAPAGAKKLTSRQIPVGKKLFVTRRKARPVGDIESTVIKNTDTELTLKLSQPLRVTFGETWCIRYYSGASVWEFDTSAISYDGDILVLNHSDTVRFVNRRRFLRVPVRLRAFIAHFPFTRRFEGTSKNVAAEVEDERDVFETVGDRWGPPGFVPAVVTELAGPGLRIESTMEIEQDQRILVVFCPDEDCSEDSNGDEAPRMSAKAKIIENIGEVRHVKPVTNGFSFAVELIGLSDSNVDELIRVTNAASVRSHRNDADATGSASEQQRVAASSVAQGV